jgi:formylglycine-generating enzyme required for sulfatase activity/3',5'-cyclic AMP phosphodiesterase CpdA/energy-coupling factor transporter ATP-binding protein EcfA2
VPGTEGDRTFRWLHISDLHLGRPGPEDGGLPYAAEVVLRSLVTAFKDGGAFCDRRPDVIFCTGDVAYSGKAEEYAAGEELFKRLLAATDVPISRTFIVPGNHDLDRGAVSRFLKIDLATRKEADGFFREPESREFAFTRFKAFAAFHRKLLELEISGAKPYVAERVPVRGFELGVLGINTAWFAHENEVQGKLLASEYLVRQALDTLCGPEREHRPDLVVALLHHPTHWLRDFERHRLREILVEACDVVLLGHEHHDRPELVETAEGKALLVQGGASFQGRDRPNTAYLVEADLGGRQARFETLIFRDRVEGRWEARGTAFEVEFPLREAAPAATSPEPTEVTVPPAYLRWIGGRTRWVDLLGVSTGGKTTQIRLDEVYVPLRAPVREDIREFEAPDEESRPAPEPVPLEVKFRDSPFLVLIGDPGCGKTTFLRRIAHHLAGIHLGESGSRETLGFSEGDDVPWPLLVRLPALSPHLPDPGAEPPGACLGDALEAWAREEDLPLPSGFLKEQFRQRRVALLLDGLDEIPDEPRRAAAVQAIRKAAALLDLEEGPGGIVVASRPRAYDGRVVLGEPFVRHDILPLEEGDVASFAECWMRAVYGVPADTPLEERPDAKDELGHFLGAVSTNEEVAAFSRQPVLLTVLVLVHHTRRRLPEQRASLYDEMVDVVLRRFKGHPRWPIRVLRKHLAEVAQHMMGSAGEGETARGIALDIIACRLAADGLDAVAEAAHRDEAEEMLSEQELQAGLLVAPDCRHVRFVHRTFQEYLAASWIARQGDRKRFRIFDEKLAEASWHEALSLTVGILSSQGQEEGLVAHLCGKPHVDLRLRAPGIAAIARFWPEMEQYNVSRSVVEPIRGEAREIARLVDTGEVETPVRIGLAGALGLVGDPRLTEENRWVHVPAGPFLFGDGRPEPEEVEEFWIQRWPVTVREYAAFVDAGGYEKPDWWDDPGRAWREENAGPGEPRSWATQRRLPSNHPVTGVCWHEARAYCAWRTSRETDHVVRLPKEKEWEKAARGGLVLADGTENPDPAREYPWVGEDWSSDLANCWEGGVQSTTPVGSYPGGNGPCQGTWDQAGNVWEWCEDVHERGAEVRVVRGGSWLSTARLARSAFRGWDRADLRRRYLGFRPARSVTTE